MNYENFVKENQKIIQAIKDRVPGDDKVDMFYGTLDVATARFHTILLKLSLKLTSTLENKRYNNITITW